jgi:hypothetical protein
LEYPGPSWIESRQPAITAIKAALEAKDEPVGKFAKFTDGIWREVTDGSAGVPFYTAPPQRTWVGLTEAQCGVLWKINMTPFDYYQAIEAKLKDKNI